MFHITLVCDGLPASSGLEGARAIAQEFTEHRTWHAHVTCEWENNRLVLQVENDFDEDGTDTLEEFSECISDCIAAPGNFHVAIQSVSEVNPA